MHRSSLDIRSRQRDEEQKPRVHVPRNHAEAQATEPFIWLAVGTGVFNKIDTPDDVHRERVAGRWQ